MLLSRSLRPTALPVGIRQILACHPMSAYSTTSATPPPPPSSPPPQSAAPTSTVSETEMSHFSALASSWWDPHGPSRILHLMNPLRHTFIQRCRALAPSPVIVNQEPQTLKYLDIGCGGGIFAESAARLHDTHSVTAIDPTPEVIAVARKHALADPALLAPGRLNYLNTAIENLAPPPDPRDGVDVLSLFEVIEHIRHPAPFLAQCLPHVRPGGWLVLSTMSRTWTSWLTTIVAAEDILRVVPRGTHDWNQYIDVGEMRAWAAKQKGWSHATSMGVVYVPGIGWREVEGSESWGNYFFAIRKDD